MKKSNKVFNSMLIICVILVISLITYNLFALDNENKDGNDINYNDLGEISQENNNSSQLNEKSEGLYEKKNEENLDKQGSNEDSEVIAFQNQESFDNLGDYSELKIKDQLENITNGYNIDYVDAIRELEVSLEIFYEANGNIPGNLTLEESNNKINNGVMAILRKDRYYDNGIGMESIFWGTIAGSTNPSLKGVLKLLDNDLKASIARVNTNTLINGEELSIEEVEAIHDLMTSINSVEKFSDFLDPISGDNIDFIHLIASLDSLYTDVDMEDDIELFVDYLAGWAGDLLTFIPDFLGEVDKGTLESSEYKEYVKETLGSQAKSHFSQEDLLADVDAVNLNTVLKSDNLLLSEGIIWYYNSRALKSRYSSFINSFGSQDEFEQSIRIIVMYEYMTEEDLNNYDFTLTDINSVMSLFEDIFKHRPISKVELEALSDGFLEIIIERMNDEVERSW